MGIKFKLWASSNSLVSTMDHGREEMVEAVNKNKVVQAWQVFALWSGGGLQWRFKVLLDDYLAIFPCLNNFRMGESDNDPLALFFLRVQSPGVWHWAQEQMTSLEHMIKLERLAAKELKKEEVALFMEYATIEKVKVVIEATEAALWAYNFSFDEYLT
ncbi:hypothetical protein COCNU_09G002290 [Cocos nucifera]|uniref:Uncharacterized protein n=1 Tax=Cocos nucifera TaxID=13894 RepID=A0A8K0N7K2_COCNU|nr:hypothetical protein COCNU_09G002290 [Cocos nucifera]